MTPYTDALELIKSIGFGLRAESLPLEDCQGLQLAEDIKAKIPSPPFTNSAMDGYAIKHEEAAHGSLKLLGKMFAGKTKEAIGYERAGCVAIMTGAAVPEWADTVVPVEQTSEEGGRISFKEISPKGANIRHRGEDIDVGAMLLRSGCQLTPERLMVAAAFGEATLKVYPKPHIHIISTGDELKQPGTKLDDGEIYNSSRFFLAASCQQLGLPYTVTTIADDEAIAQESIRQALEDKPGLILTTGAVSAGEKDFIPQLAESLDFQTLMHKAAIRPGKPVYLAQKGEHVWLGLPGNAISTCVGWWFFARPLLETWAGIKAPIKRKVKIQNTFRKPEHLRCFFRAEANGDKVWIAPKQGSAFVAASIQADCYVELPEGQSVVKADTEVLATFI